MSFNGSGSFLINTAGQPVVSGTVISSTAFNALTADLATGLSTCITKDGQTTVTANIPMANYKFTGLGAGSGAADSANLSQVQSTVVKLLASVSGTDTITAVGSPTVSAYAAGQMFYFVAAGDNTGAVTINIDSLGAKAVTRDGSVALVAGDIKSGEVVVIVYDGTRFQVVSQLNSAGNATFANVSITSALNVGGVATFSAGTAAAPSITTSGDTNNGIFFPATDVTAITTAGSERLRVDASGNLGLGVTPSAWGSSRRAIQIGGNTVSSISLGAAIGENLYNCYTASANFVYTTNGPAASFDFNNATSGGFAWRLAASGTAGNAITFTQAMTLDANGTLTVKGTGSGNGNLIFDDPGTAIVSAQGTAGSELILNGRSLIKFTTGGTPTGTERARITSGGYFKASNTGTYVGATGTYHEMVSNDTGNTLVVRNSSTSSVTDGTIFISNARNTTDNTYYILSAYNTTAAAFKFRVADSGDVTNTNNSYGAISDVKMKTDIVDAGSQWDDIKAVRFRKFKMKDDPDQIVQLGVVAQELEQTSPGLVDEHQDYEEFEVTDNDGNATKKRRPTGTSTKSVKTSVLLMKAAVALQEAMARIEQLEAKVAALETK